jgi:hypothetical protein
MTAVAEEAGLVIRMSATRAARIRLLRSRDRVNLLGIAGTDITGLTGVREFGHRCSIWRVAIGVGE